MILRDKKLILLSWSGGKDSALALYSLLEDKNLEIELFTTINIENGRVAMHGFNEQLLDKQVESIGLPLHKIFIPDPCSNEEYSRIMNEFMLKMKIRGIDTIAFGDLFLEDIRHYREENLKKLDILAIFPLWETPTANIALEFIRKGFKAILTCVDTIVLPPSLSGKEFNLNLLGELPQFVDPCGENGEFHTFVYDGPVFKFPIQFSTGEQILKYERFCFTDLI